MGDGKHQHFTAEDLFEKAKICKLKVSLATVYNTLHSFSDSGLLNKVIVDGSRCYFDTRLDNHSHFYWEATGKLTDAPGNFLEIKNLPKPPKNSKITNVDIIIRLKEN
jgi:Fur family iron response transcriptional regulator